MTNKLAILGDYRDRTIDVILVLLRIILRKAQHGLLDDGQAK